MFELMDAYSKNAIIKVIGVGGGGCNAVSHMIATDISGVEFVCINTDAETLKDARAPNVLQIGRNITNGYGAGSDPEVGRLAAMEDRDRIQEVIEKSDLLFITAGMGGGTGTGAAPIVAQVAKELGILTVALVTKPFKMEGDKRMQVADQGISELARFCDSLIVIPNQKWLSVGHDDTLLDAFAGVNEVLRTAAQGIAELITRPGLINVDFADLRTVIAEMGAAMMGSGVGSGAERAREAAEAAISSPLLEDINLAGAKGVLVNVTAGKDLSIGEFEEIGAAIIEFASEEATVVIGTVINPNMKDNIRVTVVFTGLGIQLHRETAESARTVRGGSERPILNTDLVDSQSDADTSAVPPIRVIAEDSVSHEELAELIVHLSNVYRSVGGDELVVDAVRKIPPDIETKASDLSMPERRATK